MTTLLALLATAAFAGESPAYAVVEPIEERPPAFPDGPDLVAGEVTCSASIVIEATGVPSDVEVSGCPERFAAAVREALPSWRWTPEPSRLPFRAKATFGFFPGRRVEGEPRGVHVVHGRAVTRLVRPRMPPERHGAWDGPPVVCDAAVEIGPDGRVAAVDVPVGPGCPEAFAREARSALGQWRFAAAEGGTQRMSLPVRFFDDHADPTDQGRPPTAPPEPGVVLVRSVQPEVPLAARALGPGRTFACRVAVTLAGGGRPDAVEVLACPAELRDAVADAVRRWRWTRTTPDAPALAGWRAEVELKVRIP